jgi:hypothetical protein
MSDASRPFWASGNLRPRDPAFTGRDPLLDDVRKRLVAGEPVVLVGPPGVGRSHAAAEYAHRFQDEYEQVLWVDGGTPYLADTSPAEIRRAFVGRTRWLLIVDDLQPGIPVADGPGHVLVTAGPDAVGAASPMDVDPLPRAASLGLLDGVREADLVADALGDLPLALRLAARTLAETGVPTKSYVDELAAYAWEAVDETPLASAVLVATAHLQTADPAAADLLRLCAHLAPQPIPAYLFHSEGLPAALAGVAGVVGPTSAVARAARRIVRFGLAHDHGGLVLHPAVQAVVRDSLAPAVAAETRVRVERLLVAAQPESWTTLPAAQQWNPLVPHLFAAGPESTTDDELRLLAARTIRFMSYKGQHRLVARAGRFLYGQWVRRLGSDDPYARMVAAELDDGE